jgi:hypothetical protein
MFKITAALFVALIALAPSSAAAQNTQSNRPLTGGVELNSDPTTSVRINRHNFHSGVNSSDFSSSMLPQQPQTAPLLDARTFQGAVNEIRKFAPLLHSGASAAGNPPAIPQVGAPYIWYQSALGGYFDGSQTTKELVRADRLYLFGGKFADGTPVPKEPIRDMNAMGHAFRQAMTPTQAFWSH